MHVESCANLAIPLLVPELPVHCARRHPADQRAVGGGPYGCPVLPAVDCLPVLFSLSLK